MSRSRFFEKGLMAKTVFRYHVSSRR